MLSDVLEVTRWTFGVIFAGAIEGAEVLWAVGGCTAVAGDGELCEKIVVHTGHLIRFPFDGSKTALRSALHVGHFTSTRTLGIWHEFSTGVAVAAVVNDWLDSDR